MQCTVYTFLLKHFISLKASDVQAPLSLPQHPPPPPSAVAAAAQKGAGVSAGDEPTNEELLEATQDHNEPLQPPAAMEVTAETPAPAPHPGAASPPPPGVQELTEPAVLPPPSLAGSSEVKTYYIYMSVKTYQASLLPSNIQCFSF